MLNVHGDTLPNPIKYNVFFSFERYSQYVVGIFGQGDKIKKHQTTNQIVKTDRIVTIGSKQVTPYCFYFLVPIKFLILLKKLKIVRRGNNFYHLHYYFKKKACIIIIYYNYLL